MTTADITPTRVRLFFVATIAMTLCWPAPASADGPLAVGMWDAYLEGPGGRLEFGLEVVRENEGYRAWIYNADDRIAISRVTTGDGQATFHFDHYGAALWADVAENGTKLDGGWRLYVGVSEHVKLPFHARLRSSSSGELRPPSEEDRVAVSGQWSVAYDDVDWVAIARLELGAGNRVQGTVISRDGDRQTLAGTFRDGRLQLSRFDGGIALMLTGSIRPDGSLRAEVWEGAGHAPLKLTVEKTKRSRCRIRRPCCNGHPDSSSISTISFSRTWRATSARCPTPS